MVHMRSHSTRKPHQCDVCDKGFVNSSSLILHMKTHLKDDPCPCSHCDKKFKTATLLAEHLLTHTDTHLYQCSICHSRFKQSCELVQHMKNHTGNKPFACSICDKSFTQSGSLNTHMRIHTGEKPFACTMCKKQFAQASSLSVHLKTHASESYVKKSDLAKELLADDCRCKWCDVLFTNSAQLIHHVFEKHNIFAHITDKTSIPCFICQQDFTNGLDLLNHLREHSMKLQWNRTSFKLKLLQHSIRVERERYIFPCFRYAGLISKVLIIVGLNVLHAKMPNKMIKSVLEST